MLASTRDESGRPASEADFQIGNWTVRPQRDCIEGPDGTVRLAPKAMAVLTCLARARGSVVPRQEIFIAVWPQGEVTDDALTQRIVELRKAFGDSAYKPAVIETIPKVGFRLMQPVVPLVRTAASRVIPTNRGEASRRGTRPARLIWGASALLLALAVGYFVFGGQFGNHLLAPGTEAPTESAEHARGGLQPRIGEVRSRSIAVLPFDTSGFSGEELLLADAFHEELLLRLLSISSLRVIAHGSVEAYWESGRPLREIARSLGVTHVLKGSIQQLEDNVRIRAQLVDTESGEYLWGDGFDLDFSTDNYFATQSKIAGQVAAALDVVLTPSESARVAEVPTENFQAYRYLLQGRAALDLGTMQGFERALALYGHALVLNPQFAQAHIAMAGAWSTALEDRGVPQALANEKIEEHALAALNLNPNLGHAYKFLAQVRRERGNYEEAETLFRTALELDPGNVHILHGLGLTLRLRGRATESVTYYDRAAELDPLSPIINESRASLLRDLGRFEEAEQQYQLTLNLHPKFSWAYWGLGTLHWSKGNPRGAAAWFEQAIQVAPQSDLFRSWLALMHLERRRDEQALAVIEETLRLVPISADNDIALVDELYGIYHGLDVSGLPDGRWYLPVGMFGGLVQLPVRDLLAGNYAAAIERYEAQYPGISRGGMPVDGSNYRAATYVAFALDRLGERSRALELLDRVEMVLGNMRRLGIHGYWVTDAQVEMVRGDRSRALRLLEAATQEGWRNLWRFFFFYDPILEALRDDLDFTSMAQLIEQDMVDGASDGIAVQKSMPRTEP
jgi:tetratricopeptide (TPR) repeat protein/DNA-binding winged helix-turn-helix (wHTH) protein